MASKPVGLEEHGGGHKLPLGSRTDKNVRRSLEDYAAVVKGKYQTAADLPEPSAEVSFLTQQQLRIVDSGHSVVVIEHNLDVIKTADYLIDLGPEGGHKGGRLLAWGTPEEAAACNSSHTGRFLAETLRPTRHRKVGRRS